MNLKKLFIGVLAIASIAACKKENYYMSLSEKSITVSSEGGTFTFDLTTNVYVRVNNDQEDWTQLEEISKVGNTTTYLLTVLPNKDTEAKSGTIRFIGDHVTPLKLDINQKKYIPLGVDPAVANVKCDATSVIISVCGEKPWTAAISGKGGAGWTVSPAEGTTGQDVTVSFPANTTTEDITADLDVTFEDGTICSAKIVHQGVPTGIDPKTIEVTYSTTSVKATVLGNQSWSATVDKDGWSVAPASGTGETEVTISFPVNETTSNIVGTVSVSMGGKTYNCAVTQKAAPQRIDLSANGTANSYVVSACGPYKFNACVRGNGVAPQSSAEEVPTAITPKSAKVLWCTYNTTAAPQSVDEIISNVKIVDGYVQFATTSEDQFTNANVIIAAYESTDCTGDIIWTWHIWLTDAPADVKIGDDIWQDRHLGATCANIQGDARSCGLYYQWGRKDPMRSPSTFTDGDFIATCPEPQGDEIEVNVSETTGTISASIKNPRAFINTAPSGGTAIKDWIFSKGNIDRWGDDKTMFDPCPAGYKVPSSAQMVACGAAAGFESGSQKGDNYKAAYQPQNNVFATNLFSWPIGGMISYNDGTKLTDVNVACRLETSTWNKEANTLYFNGNGSACNFANNATAGHAGAVRCVKE